MKILITGGGGYIGTALATYLVSREYSVEIVDTFWFGDFLTDRKIVKHQFDIREEIPTPHFGIPDAIIHLASIANDPSADLDSRLSWEVGCLGTMKILDWAKKNKVVNVLLASSGSVYGVSGADHVTEEVPPKPISTYNKVKMVKERIALSYQDNFRLVILRPATVGGLSARQRLDLAVNALTYSASTTGTVFVDGGSQTRPHVHILDMLRAYEFFLNNNFSGVFNVGFENLTMEDLAQRISLKTGASIEFTDIKDPRSYRLNSEKLLSLGFKPQMTIDDAIQEISDAISRGELRASDDCYNVKWMKRKFEDGSLK